MTVKYIFSINTGRSGSNYLAKIFENVVGCRSFHEPSPIGNGQAMRDYARGRIGKMKRVTAEKVKAINQIGCDLYFESNHCFIKGFGWMLPDNIPEEEIGVIILNRSEARLLIVC